MHLLQGLLLLMVATRLPTTPTTATGTLLPQVVGKALVAPGLVVVLVVVLAVVVVVLVLVAWVVLMRMGPLLLIYPKASSQW
jgi:hypothetical protein